MTSGYNLEDIFGASRQRPGHLRMSQHELEELCKVLLLALGEDPDREGLRETPRRWARWWDEFMNHDPGNLDTGFSSDRVNEMVVVSGIEAWSLCEHHLLPFSVEVKIGYLTRGKMLGLSKFARIVHAQAHRLNVQEQLTQDIADRVSEITGSPDVGVVANGEHLCTVMRGVRTAQTMTTSVMRGKFRSEATRAEFMNLG